MERRAGIASDRTHERLGFGRVLEALATRCNSGVAAARCRTLFIAPPGPEGADSFARVRELFELLADGERLPLGSLDDLRPMLELAGKDGVLEGTDLLSVAALCEGFAGLVAFYRSHAARFSACAPVFEAVPVCAALASAITETIDETGRIRDSASPELADLRQRISSVSKGLRDRIDNLSRGESLSAVLQEPWFTLRENRYVLPVISEKRSLVKGIVHGSSRSGETVFIEPQELVEANNRLKMLSDEAERLEFQIYTRMTQAVRSEARVIEAGLEAGWELDGLKARAELGRDWRGVIPEFGGPLDLKGARNPLMLLQGQAVVANDVSLAHGRKVMVVSGPNAGGKSVLLSTIGNCVLAAAAGIPIPVGEGSTLPEIRRLHVLQGDLQNVEEHLSTFSGHVLELQGLCGELSEKDMVLIDEIVTGTEAEQGAALAAAFLLELAPRAGAIFVTTHHGKLKALGFSNPLFENGAFGLLPDSQKPSFKFTPGLPGTSNPLDVAESLGVDRRIVTVARSLLTSETDLLAKAIAELQRKSGELELSRLEQTAARQKLEEEERRCRAATARMEKQAAKVIEERVDGALGEVNEALTRIKQIVSDLQKGDRRPGFIEHQRREVRELAEKIENRSLELKAARTNSASRIPEGTVLEAGAKVIVRKLQREGQVQAGPDNSGLYRIRIGGMSTQASIDELLLPPRSEQRPAAPAASFQVLAEPRKTSTQLDLRGMLVEDALEELERALDQALLEGRWSLRIIHGHGTGRVRTAVRQALKRNRQVVKSRPGDKHEGGDGVTVAILDESLDLPSEPEM